jgi:hypothetical protein
MEGDRDCWGVKRGVYNLLKGSGLSLHKLAKQSWPNLQAPNSRKEKKSVAYISHFSSKRFPGAGTELSCLY